ncbi:unannotated protein [freshwater metagenome]|uniref:Unannotated protein n=1 Tax=freshwater metagenome TaxID=449393 RepID=A0A6J6PTD6_9ZZZZ
MIDEAGVSPHRRKFLSAYFGLSIIGVGAIATFIALVGGPGLPKAKAWSDWKPKSGSALAMATSIADHVAHEYRLDDGSQLVAVLPGKPPQITSGTSKVAVSAIAVRKVPQSNTGLTFYNADSSVQYVLCGLGASCAIDSGTPSTTRGRLVRREALELALYTFKYVSGVDSVVAFLPPANSSVSVPIVFLKKSTFATQLKQPLNETLQLSTPPSPSAPDAIEAKTIDDLTLSSVFTYGIAQLQNGGVAMVLDPAT